MEILEVFNHFFFELFKISFLSCFYAILALLIFKIIGHFNRNSWFGRVSRKKLRLWFICILFNFIGLFIYMFTPWGYHGIGESYSIPIGHFKTVQWNEGAYIRINNTDIDVINFFYDSDNFYATLVQPENYYPQYYFMIYDLDNDNVKYYKTKEDYLIATKLYNYPTPDKFKDFMTYYRQYWNGWRFWLLP